MFRSETWFCIPNNSSLYRSHATTPTTTTFAIVMDGEGGRE